MGWFFKVLLPAAFLLLLLYLFIAFLTDGYFDLNIFPNDLEPDAWAAPDSWAEWRDITIVGIGAVFLLAGLIFCALLVAILVLVVTIRRVVRDNLAPALDSLKGTLDNVRGTTEFVGETAVTPIVRVYSIVRGIRTGLGAVTGVGDRIRRRKK